MTLTIELAPEVERVLVRKAQQRGVKVEQYVSELAERDAHENAQEQDEIIAARLRALDKIGSYNTRKGLPELDLSGSRSDVYGYTEREDAQL